MGSLFKHIKESGFKSGFGTEDNKSASITENKQSPFADYKIKDNILFPQYPSGKFYEQEIRKEEAVDENDEESSETINFSHI